MSLKDRITGEMKDAMRARDAQRLGAIRLLLAAIKQREVDDRITLEDSQVIEVIEKMLKQRRDSISQYEAAQRHDLVAAEKFEASLLQTYLPQPLTANEIAALLDQAVAEVGASGIKDMGKVMAALRPRVLGRADMGSVSGLIKAKLGS